MLIGNYSSNLTSGRRVAIPKKFREEIGKKIIIAKWYEGCLVVSKIDKWREIMDLLTGRASVITAPVRDTDRFVMGSAFELEADAQGRVILPQQLVEYGGLKSEVLFVGLGNRVEIWAKEEWERRESYLSEKASEMVEKLALEQKGGVAVD